MNKQKPENFIHPLSSVETIETDDGQKEAINNWAFASMIWSAVLTNNSNARQIAKELFSNIPDGQDKFLSLYFRSKFGNEAAVREAMPAAGFAYAILAIAVEEKLQQSFDNFGNSEKQ